MNVLAQFSNESADFNQSLQPTEDKKHHPVPEPATYGLILTGLMLALVVWRRMGRK